MSVEQRKVSQLPDIGQVTGEEYFHIAHNGRSFKVTMNELIRHFTAGVDMSVVDQIRDLVNDLPDLSQFTTAAQLQQVKEYLEAKIPSLEGFATAQQVTEAIAHAIGAIQFPEAPEAPDLSEYAKTVDVQQSIQEAIAAIEFPEAPAAPDLSGYVTNEQLIEVVGNLNIPPVSDLSGLATKEELNHEIQNLIIPSVEGLVTKLELEEAIGAIPTPEEAQPVDLSEYAKTADVQQAIDQAVADISLPEAVDLSDFARKSEVTRAVEDMTALIAQEAAGLESLSTMPIGRIKWVGPNQGDGNGSITSPFNSIQEAIDSIPENGNTFAILVAPGTATNQNAVVEAGRSSILIQGFGAYDSHVVQIKGSIVARGSSVTRLRLKDFSIQAQGDQPGLVYEGTAGRHYHDNITIEKGAGHTGPLVSFRGGEARWSVFTACTINGDIEVAADVDPAHVIYFNNNNGSSNLVVAGGTAAAIRGGFIGSVTGNVKGAASHTSFSGNADNQGIVNTGPVPFQARFCDFEKADGTFLENVGATMKLCNHE